MSSFAYQSQGSNEMLNSCSCGQVLTCPARCSQQQRTATHISDSFCGLLDDLFHRAITCCWHVLTHVVLQPSAQLMSRCSVMSCAVVIHISEMLVLSFLQAWEWFRGIVLLLWTLSCIIILCYVGQISRSAQSCDLLCPARDRLSSLHWRRYGGIRVLASREHHSAI